MSKPPNPPPDDHSDDYDGPARPVGALDEAPVPDLSGEPDAVRARVLNLFPLQRNDLGNARRMVALFGDDLAFIEDDTGKGTGFWLVWDGTVWQRQGSHGRARALAQRVGAAVIGEAQMMAVDKVPGWKGYRDFGYTLGNGSKISAMMAEARVMLARDGETFDRQHRVVVVENGTILLPPPRRAGIPGAPDATRGGSLRPQFQAQFRREDLTTKKLPVFYDPDAICPKFEAFLERVQPNADIRDYLKAFFGYCLSGDTSAQMLMMFYGQGANGKSTLLNIIAGILGEYAVNMKFASFQPSKNADGSSHNADMARVIGRRLALASEPDDHPLLATGTIKTHTGSEKLAIRDIHEKAKEITPTHKIVMSFNKRPRVAALDHGTWRRLSMVPWDVIIPPEERVPDLDRMLLEAEAPGILNWLLDGWEIFAAEGLVKPQAVIDTTEEYRSDSDPLGDWVAGALVFESQPGSDPPRPWCDWDDDQGEAPWEWGKTMRDSYLKWCENEGIDAMSANRFGLLLKDRRDMVRRKVSNMRYYGVTIKPECRPAVENQKPTGEQRGLM